MQGKHVTLWLYHRGNAARDLPYLLWSKVEEAGDWERLLWSDPFDPTRVPRFGDLTHWMSFMFDEQDPKVFVLAADNETGDVAGFIWFNRVIMGKSAYGSIWMDPYYRGKPHVRETGELGLRWGHKELGCPTIYTVTPWPDVRNFDKKIGFKEVAAVPKLLGPDLTWFLEHTEEQSHGG